MMTTIASAMATRTEKKRRVVRYDRERAFDSVVSDYLVHESRFDDEPFERHFRITKSIFECVFRCLAANDPYWRNGKDCTKRPKITPEVKLPVPFVTIFKWGRVPLDELYQN